MQRRSFFIVSGLAACGGLAAGAAWSQLNQVRGAGASLPRSVYDRWSQKARETTGVEVSYEAVGSVEGVDRITSRTVDFGASDAPRSLNRLREGALLQFPSVFGAVVAAVNLPGVPEGQLRLAPEVLADIFLGKIGKWNDTRIAEHNRELRLPDLPIVPIHRSEGSGTTFIFTTYLSRVSEAWANGPRTGTTVKWPGGRDARGSGGVADLVAGTPGAICYLDASSAVARKLSTAQLRNKSGAFVKPDEASFAAAAGTADLAAPNLAFDVIDADPAVAWPLVAPSFVLLPTNPPPAKIEPLRNAMKFFDWAYRDGGDAAKALGFVPLPNDAAAAVRETWKAVKTPDGRSIWPA